MDVPDQSSTKPQRPNVAKKFAEAAAWASPLVALGMVSWPSKSSPLYFGLGLIVTLAVLFGTRVQTPDSSRYDHLGAVRVGILPFAFTLFAPLNLLVSNYLELSTHELAISAVFLVACPIVVLVILAHVSRAQPWRTWLFASLIFTVLIGPVIRDVVNWPEAIVLFVVLLVGALFILFFRAMSKSKLASWTVVAILAGSLSFDFASAEEFQRPGPEALQSSVDSYLEGAESNNFLVAPHPSRPSISVLVYDAYPNQELATGLEISIRENLDFLSNQGFTIYPGVISSGSNSLASMGRVFNASHESLSTITSRYVVSGGGAVFRAYKDAGYVTVGVHPWSYFYPDDNGFSDISWPREGDRDSWNFLATVLEGEIPYNGYWKAPHEDYLAQKRSQLSIAHQVPTLLYSHDYFPGHTQNSGRCRAEDSLDAWEPRLRLAEEEMASDLKSFTNLDDHIIVIMSDHGPYLTKNCFVLEDYPPSEITRLDIQDRYGTFLAIRWPPHLRERGEGIEIGTIQDLFLAISHVLSSTSSDSGYEGLARNIDGAVLPAGVSVEEGKITGGVDSGKPIFETFGQPTKSPDDEILD